MPLSRPPRSNTYNGHSVPPQAPQCLQLQASAAPGVWGPRRCCASLLLLLLLPLVLLANSPAAEAAAIVKRSYSDQSVRGYLTERACWWNEICKEEFQTQFRCKCPQWSYCRSPGRYYNAYCTVTGTGYIWTQPGWGGAAAAAAPAAAAGA
ncbi:hypothetical protein ONE63_010579 [Megalurothrips usitatus]|uniref:Uncharacterized protein n=1 Tax=Megalurothrips usitatus TaxID=439358 RepID=A0AAV7XEC6_9NEOP|nr:hypothetical protein ONE63_010579 [Megalurothrips usitatus]